MKGTDSAPPAAPEQVPAAPTEYVLCEFCHGLMPVGTKDHGCAAAQALTTEQGPPAQFRGRSTLPRKLDGLGNPVLGSGLYYVQDSQQYVGNCVSWWRPEGRGYTCELSKAGKYFGSDVSERETDIPWPVAHVEARVVRHVRGDHLRDREASPAPQAVPTVEYRPGLPTVEDVRAHEERAGRWQYMPDDGGSARTCRLYVSEAGLVCLANTDNDGELDPADFAAYRFRPVTDGEHTPVAWGTPAALLSAPPRGLSEEERAEVEDIRKQVQRDVQRASTGRGPLSIVDLLANASGAIRIIDRLTGAEARTGTEEP